MARAYRPPARHKCLAWRLAAPHYAHGLRRAPRDAQQRVAVGARDRAARVEPDAVVALEALDAVSELGERARALVAGALALVLAADGDRLDQRAEQVGVRVVDVVAGERQAVAAAAQPARDAEAERARDPRPVHDLEVEARLHAPA